MRKYEMIYILKAHDEEVIEATVAKFDNVLLLKAALLRKLIVGASGVWPIQFRI